MSLLLLLRPHRYGIGGPPSIVTTTFVVPYEARTFTIADEPRRFEVPFAPRTFVVPRESGDD